MSNPIAKKYIHQYIFSDGLKDSSTTLVYAKKSEKPKPVIEDAGFVSYNREKDLFVGVVADGITKLLYPKQNYSSSAVAARMVANIIGTTLIQSADNSDEYFKQAYDLANKAVAQINKEESSIPLNGELLERVSYDEHDIAGVVASAVVRKGNRIRYGFIGDCQILILSKEGRIVWRSLNETTNKVEQSRRVFSMYKKLPPRDSPDYYNAFKKYRSIVHSQFRNNPKAKHSTYGVLTGEKDAIDEIYLFIGEVACEREDTLVLCSDGLENFIDSTGFRKVLVEGNREMIEDFIDTHRDLGAQNDDKCIIVNKII